MSTEQYQVLGVALTIGDNNCARWRSTSRLKREEARPITNVFQEKIVATEIQHVATQNSSIGATRNSIPEFIKNKFIKNKHERYGQQHCQLQAYLLEIRAAGSVGLPRVSCGGSSQGKSTKMLLHTKFQFSPQSVLLVNIKILKCKTLNSSIGQFVNDSYNE